jgi:hypothetical protein
MKIYKLLYYPCHERITGTFVYLKIITIFVSLVYNPLQDKIFSHYFAFYRRWFFG